MSVLIILRRSHTVFNTLNATMKSLMKELIKKGFSRPHHVPPFLLKNAMSYYVQSQYYNHVHCSDELCSVANRTWEFTDTVEHLGPDLAQELVPDKSVPLCSGTNYQFRRPFVCEVQDCELVGPYAVGKTTHKKFIEDMLSRPFNHGDLQQKVSKTLMADYKSLITRTSSTSYQCTAVIHRSSGSQNYYHWLIDHLLKLRGIERYEQATGEEVTIIRSRHTPDFVKEAFELLGFGEHRVVEWDKSSRIATDKLVVSSWPDPTPEALTWLRKSMGTTATDETAGNWLYISRQNASRGRTVVNFEEVSSVLDDFGVEIVRPEEWSLQKQISKFAAAEGIIGPHGAGLTNMIWGDDITVIELFGERVKGPFYILAHLLNHEYHTIFGIEVSDQEVSNPLYRNIRISTDKLKELLTVVM